MAAVNRLNTFTIMILILGTIIMMGGINGVYAICDGPGLIQCGNASFCVNISALCDNRNNCPNKFDESRCLLPSTRCKLDSVLSGACTPHTSIFCPQDRFLSRDKRACLHIDLVCNGRFDAYDGSDEEKCVCNRDSNCGSQIPECRSRRCNGTVECDRDASDELECDSCSLNAFHCPRERRCISMSKRCDGVSDCKDASDEEHCDVCPSKLRCEDTGKCVPVAQICNGHPDCDSGIDEQGCHCSYGEFRCDTKRCVKLAQVCDGKFDCDDYTDERECGKSGDGVITLTQVLLVFFTCLLLLVVVLLVGVGWFFWKVRYGQRRDQILNRFSVSCDKSVAEIHGTCSAGPAPENIYNSPSSP